MATGTIRDVFPPNNDGSNNGAGQIEETLEGVAQGPPYFVFHTPGDVDAASVPLNAGDSVIFDKPASGNKVANVAQNYQ